MDERSVPASEGRSEGSATAVESASQPVLGAWASPEPGSMLGRYRLLEELGQGAMGVVFSARDERLGRDVALKLVHPHRWTSAAARRRFEIEAELLARVAHPNVVEIYDFGSHDGRQFFVMEKVEAPTLGEWLTAAPRPPAQILACFGGIARGLAAAHAAGVVHRDFKPANVLVDKALVAKVTDFGLALSADGASGDRDRTPAGSDDHDAPPVRSERRGSGTPAYMAPEQHDGSAVGPPADQYAFFTALFEALQGARPFRSAERDIRQLSAAKRGGLPRSALAGLPRWLQPLVRRGLEPEPSARFESMEVVASLLARKRRNGLALAGVGVSAVAAGLAIAMAPPTLPDCASGARAELDPSWEVIGAPAEADASEPGNASALGHGRAMAEQWRDRWLTTRVEACELARAGELADAAASARRACLDHQRDVVSALLGGRAPAAWASAAGQLPAPEECRFVGDRLAEITTVPEAVVREMESTHAEAQVALLTGEHDRALQLGGDLQARSQAAGLHRLYLSASLVVADALGETDRAQEGADLLRSVVDEARERRMPQLAARAGSALTWMLGVRLRDVPAAEQSARVAQMLAMEAEESVSLRASILTNLSVVMEVNDQLGEAYRLVLEASALVDAAPAEAPTLRRIRTGLATRRVTVGTKLGRYEEAAAWMEDAMARAREDYGNLSLATLGVVAASAELERIVGGYLRARGLHAELDAAFTQRDGPRSRWVAQNLMNESRLDTELWDFEAAGTRLDRGCEISAEATGDDSTHLVICTLMQLEAQAMLDRSGDPEPPEAASSRCEEIDRLRGKVMARFDPGSTYEIDARYVLARCWVAAGRHEAALEILDALSEVVTESVRASDIALLSAEAHRARGDFAAARAGYRRARTLVAPRLRPALRLVAALREASLSEDDVRAELLAESARLTTEFPELAALRRRIEARQDASSGTK